MFLLLPGDHAFAFLACYIPPVILFFLAMLCLLVLLALFRYLLSLNFAWHLLLVPTSMTVWPSGLRRWLKAPFRMGVGSNPTAVTLQTMALGS